MPAIIGAMEWSAVALRARPAPARTHIQAERLRARGLSAKRSLALR